MSSLKLISATDTQYSGIVLKKMNEQRNIGLFCDVTIIIQDKKFRAHKAILSASSTYFHQLFSVAGQVIELNFIRAEIFEQILNYIYSSKIVRIRSDMLEELISAGQMLGVKFIANLGVPLSQVKGLPGLSKETGNKSDASSESMPLITDSFSISAEEFNQTRKKADDDDSDGDVMFVSKTDAQTRAANKKAAPTEVIDLDLDSDDHSTSAKNQESKDAVTKEHKESTAPTKTDSVKISDHNSALSVPNTSPNVPSSPARVSSESAPTPTTPARSNSQVTPERPAEPPVTAQPNVNSDTIGVQKKPNEISDTIGVQKKPNEISDTIGVQNKPNENSNTIGIQKQRNENSDTIGVQKKQISIVTKTNDFKMRLSDVSSGGKMDESNLDVLKSVMASKKTITLDKASEIDSISTGCKVYANIGENTYDIVPVKEDPGEGGSKLGKGKRSSLPASPTDSGSPKSGLGKKKAKTEPEDHYELIMDGKTFFVCMVCKRPYVCLTSLRRHFNTHSWEKKYPCHYCDKVFALAEYRTKHEIHHTGEKRYQCLLCNETFLNYQVLSTHCKQAHNQDPSGRKEKDDGSDNLYRLLPCRTLQMKPYSWSTEDLGIPVIGEDGTVQCINPSEQEVHQSKTLTWSDMFVGPAGHAQPVAHSRSGPIINPPPPNQGSTEFDFVIPETY